MNERPENKTLGDAFHKVVHTGLGSVPLVGTPLAALFETIFTPPIEKRKEKWLKELAKVITEIQERVDNLDPEALSRNEVFISMVMKASQVAIRSHQEEKISALRNALLNSVLSNSPNEDIQAIFLNLIDEFTPWHIRLLSLVNDPAGWMKNNNVKNPSWSMGGVSTVIEFCFPDLRGEKEFYRLLIRDLQSAALIVQGQILGVTMSGSGILASRTTDLGKQFLGYISKP